MLEAKKPAIRRNQEKPKGAGLRRAANKAKEGASTVKSYAFPVKPPELAPGVVPPGVTAPVMALDANPYQFAAASFPGGGFPGFPYLAQLATHAEFRAFASTLSTELTREWIEFTSKQDDDTDTAEKIKAIEDEFKRLNVRGVFQRAAEHDCYFGRAQIFLEIDGADRKTPLILDPRTIKKGSLSRVVPVEAVWTTPAGYNALDPAAPDFYKPSSWFMLGQEVHASRLMTVVTRPLPDILKPAFNFAGMSLSQLAEPYVDNWLRTRQSVADLINNFSTTALKTSMDQILQGDDDGADLLNRADLFTATRSNKGLMLLDMEREELVQINTPLSGLHELQAQSQEHMCSVSRMPAIILTGISPSGLNASSDGEIRIFYDWIAAQQEAHWREPLEVILKAVQLSLFGEIDPDIGFTFVPLYQMTPAEEADIRSKDGVTDCAYVAAGIIDPSEVRDRLAKDPNSGYMGLDTTVELVPPNPAPAPGEENLQAALDAEFDESKHPRAANGQFGSGGVSELKSSSGFVENKTNTKNFKSAQKAVSDIEKLAEEHGKVYVRWTVDPKYDMSENANSRDYVSGETHNGLSAVEISAEDHPADIASALSEYMFLRMKNPKIRPVVYKAERVGTDSDSHALIRPEEVLMQPGKEVISAIDSGFSHIVDLQDRLARDKQRLEKLPDGFGKDIVSESVAKNEKLLNEMLVKYGIKA